MSSLARDTDVPFAVRPRYGVTWEKKTNLSYGVPWAFRPAQKWVTPPLRRGAQGEGIPRVPLDVLHHEKAFWIFVQRVVVLESKDIFVGAKPDV